MPIISLHGITLKIPDSLATGRMLERLREGTYEGDEAAAARARLRPGFRVLELGAGLGYVTSVCAGIVGAENVLSVEANPDLLPVIRNNLALNGYEGVKLLHGAVTGDGDADTAAFRVGAGFVGSHLDTGDSDRGTVINVPRIPIARLLRDHRPHAVIMDVEGAEAHLFDAPWTCPLRFVVVELHPPHYPASVIKTIVDRMSDMNLTYDPGVSRGRVLAFRKIWDGDAQT